MSNSEHVELFRRGVVEWNEWREQNAEVRPDLSAEDLVENGSIRDWNESRIQRPEVQPYLTDVILSRTRLSGIDLTGAQLWRADLYEAALSNSDLQGADLRGAILWSANLSGANLSRSDLTRADLWNANLRGARMPNADLRGAQLVDAKLQGTNLAGARIYGISVWDIEVDEDTDQTGLIITDPNEPDVIVDNLEVAQFVYLLLNNEKVRDVIGTVTSKAVLILGRFTRRRKAVLEAVRDALRNRGLVPIIFDWPASPRRDLTETVQLLANMARFVVADLTDAKSIPQELSAIIPNLPSVPLQPLILSSQHEYAMFEHWRKFNSVLTEYKYNNKDHLVDNFDNSVIGPVEIWEDATDKARARELTLRERIRKLEAQLMDQGG